MKKLFVSVPMKGRTEDEIKASIAKMKRIAEAYEGEELELIDSYIEDTPPACSKRAVWYLGKSLEKLATADLFIGIVSDWNWPGCITEASVAKANNIKHYLIPVNVAIDNYDELVTKLMEERNTDME